MWMLDDMIIRVTALLCIKFGCHINVPKLTLLVPNGLVVTFCHVIYF